MIPKTTNPSRLKDNFEATHLKLTSEEMEAIDAIDTKGHGRIFNPADWPIGSYGWHQEPAFD